MKIALAAKPTLRVATLPGTAAPSTFKPTDRAQVGENADALPVTIATRASCAQGVFREPTTHQ